VVSESEFAGSCNSCDSISCSAKERRQDESEQESAEEIGIPFAEGESETQAAAPFAKIVRLILAAVEQDATVPA